jgi:hypothetical protein
MSRPKPPPPPGAERRQHERIELVASVELGGVGDVLLLTTANLSEGGAFLDGEPAKHPRLVMGAEVTLTISIATEQPAGAADRPPPPPLSLKTRARVVRVAHASGGAPGVAVAFVGLGEQDEARLKTMLARAKKQSP